MDKLAGLLTLAWNDFKTFALGFCVCFVLYLNGTNIPSTGPEPVPPPPAPGPVPPSKPEPDEIPVVVTTDPDPPPPIAPEVVRPTPQSEPAKPRMVRPRPYKPE